MSSWFNFVLGLGVFGFIAETAAAGVTHCAPSIVWQQAYGGPGLDLTPIIEPTSDGGYIMAAMSDSEPGGNKTSPHYGRYDWWVLRLDAAGNKLWERSFGGSDQELLSSLRQTADGGFVVAGTSQSGQSGNKETPLEGSSDFWLVRLDSNGNKLWERTYGASGLQSAIQLLATSDGGFMLAGPVGNSPIFGRYDVLLVKVDVDGNEQWNRFFGGTDDEWPGAILQTADGGYLLPIGSGSPVSGNKTAPFRGFNDIWLVRLDADGDILWQQSYGGDSADYPGQTIEQPDGTFLMAATSFSTPSGNKTSPNFGLNDIWLLKLSATGDKLEERTYGGSGEDWAGEMLQMPDGGLLIAGTASSMDGDRSSPYYGELDFWLLRLAADGEIVWDKSFGSTSYEFSGALRSLPDGGFLISGTTYSETGGNKTNPYYGGIDIWVLKLSSEDAPCDSDGDGVEDAKDQCLDTPPGAIVNKHGCSIDQLVPCDGPWRNHSAYVDAVIKAATKFRKSGLITAEQAANIISQAADSDCGENPERRQPR